MIPGCKHQIRQTAAACAMLAASAPLVDRLRVQPIAGRKNTGRLFRRLELGSNSRRRAGAAVKNASIALPPPLGSELHHHTPGPNT